MNRRHVLRLAGSGLMLTTAYAVPLGQALAAPKPKPRKVLAGLLLPLSGPNASLARLIERAATLAPPAAPKAEAILSFDTGGTPEGAAAATAAAIRAGAGIILGPLNAAEVRPVVAAAGALPVLSFSNDPALLDSGAFILGVTPAQSVGAILSYARGRGVRTIGVVVEDDNWGKAALAAAQRAAPGAGVTIAPVVNAGTLDAQALIAALRQGGDLPDAVLIPAGGARMAAVAKLLHAAGTQILATMQTVAGNAAENDAFNGAWLAGFDPDAYGDFVRSYQAKHGGEPGAIAALGYDAATIARTLLRGGALSRQGLLAASFKGVSGDLQFRSDGSCLRGMAILQADASGNRLIGHGSAG